jgi:hypothetical protein
LVPAYLFASLAGVSEFSFVPGSVTAALVSAAAVVIMRRVLGVVLDGPELGIAVLFFAFGTGVWSVCANAPWSHTFTLLALVLALLATSCDRFLLAGLALGLGITARPTVAVAAAVVGASLAWSRRSPAVVARIALGAIPGALALITYNGLVFGSWAPSNGYEVRVAGSGATEGDLSIKWDSLPANIVGALFSPERGLVIYYPVAVFGLLMVGAAWRSAADWERAAALGGLAVAVVQFSLNRYSGGHTFWGPRLLIEPLVLATPLLARSIALYAESRSRFIVLSCLALGVAVHAYGAVQPY